MDKDVLRTAIAAALATASISIVSAGDAAAATPGTTPVQLTAECKNPAVSLALADGRKMVFDKSGQTIGGKPAPDGVYKLATGGAVYVNKDPAFENGDNFHLFIKVIEIGVEPKGEVNFKGGSMIHPELLPAGVAKQIEALRS